MEIDKMQAALATLRTECVVVACSYPDLRDYLMAIPDMADGLAGELVRLAADLDRLTAERDQALAALRDMTAENARLVGLADALRAIADLTEISGVEFKRRHSGLNYILDDAGFDNWGRVLSEFAARAFLAVEAKP